MKESCISCWYSCYPWLRSIPAITFCLLVLAALLSTIVVSGIISRNSLRQISLSLQLPENVFVGERVFIKVTLKNLKRIFPSFSIRVEDPDLGRKQKPLPFFRRLSFIGARKEPEPATADRTMFRQAAYFPILRPRETCSELMVQSFPRRGLYQPSGILDFHAIPFWIIPPGGIHRSERRNTGLSFDAGNFRLFSASPLSPGAFRRPACGTRRKPVLDTKISGIRKRSDHRLESHGKNRRF